MSTSAAAPPKIAVCADGKVIDVTALDIGARLVVLDEERRIVRLEEAGRRFGAELGLTLAPGGDVTEDQARALAALMADQFVRSHARRLPARRRRRPAAARSAELPRRHLRRELFRRRLGIHLWRRGQERSAISGRSSPPNCAARLATSGLQLARPDARIRATVIGASQYTMQVSGSTIFVSPLDTLPLRNVPVIAPELPLGDETSIPPPSPRRSRAALKRLDLGDGDKPGRGVRAVARLGDVPAARRFLQRRRRRLAAVLAHGHPIVLAGDGDVGGLIGIHYCEEMKLENPIVSIDGLELKEFDYIDIGAILDTSGAVPVVIKSLVFPAGAASARTGRRRRRWRALRLSPSARPHS